MKKKCHRIKDDGPFALNINDIDPDAGLRLDISHPMEAFFPEVGAASSAPVEAGLDVTMLGEDIYIRGVVKGDVRMQCSRCLADYTQGLEAKIDEHFFPRTEEADDGEEGSEYSSYEGEVVELYDVLHDGLGLAMPIKPLCAEGCKGLCPNCGADLNDKKCGCPKREIDGRLAVLKNLKLDK